MKINNDLCNICCDNALRVAISSLARAVLDSVNWLCSHCLLVVYLQSLFQFFCAVDFRRNKVVYQYINQFICQV